MAATVVTDTFHGQLTILTGHRSNLSDDAVQNNITEGAIQQSVSYLESVFNSVELTFTTVGVLANLYTIYVLFKCAKDRTSGTPMFSTRVRHLLIHQSCWDAVVCLLGTGLLLEPSIAFSSEITFAIRDITLADYVKCHVWKSQVFYWYALCLSIYNLVVIAFDRYTSVCRPLEMHNTSFKRNSGSSRPSLFMWLTVFEYILASLMSIPTFFEVKIIEGVCVSDYSLIGETFFYMYSALWFLLVYTLPMTAFVILYGKVISQMLKRRRKVLQKPAVNSIACSTMQTGSMTACGQQINASGTVVAVLRNSQHTLAQSRLTKTAVVLTAFFCVAIGLDSWTYLLGSIGAMEYVLGSPLQRICVLFSVANSAINPFVYAAFMPRFRRLMLPCKRYRSRTSGPDNCVSGTRSSTLLDRSSFISRHRHTNANVAR